MKIGYLLQQPIDIRTPPFNGPANHVREVVEHLHQLGHEVRVVVNLHGRYHQTDDLQTFHPITVPWLDKGPLRWLEKVVRRIQYELNLPYAALFESIRFGAACRQVCRDFDLLFERISWASYGGALAARWLDIPLVLENNGDPLADLEAKGIAPTGMQRKLSLAVTGWAVRQAAHVVVSGDGWRREFIKRWEIPEASVTTVENGTILVERLCREQLRSFRDEPARIEPQFVYLGGFYPWQGVPILLRAFAQASQQGTKARLLLVGSGGGLEEAQRLAAELKLGEQISFTGRLTAEQYAPILADADVGLAPYCGWPEFSGLKTFDYKAAGLPTISTGLNGMPATLAHGRTALIIPPCDEAALTAAIAQLAAQPAYRRQLGQAARLEAESEHTWAHTVQQLAQIFEQVLDSPDKMSRTLQPNLISIMMPAYNAGQFIGRAIESILAQTYPTWELIIVNDGSRDDTAVIAAQYTDPRIQLVNQPNGGEATARNTALQHINSEFLAFLDADDEYLPDHLEKTVSFLQAQPERHGVYTDGYYCDTAGTRLEALSDQRRGPFTGWIFPEIVRASDVFGPPLCLLLRTGLVFEHNLQFDTRIVIGPDWDFTMKYSEWAQFGHLPDHTVLYRVHQTNITVQVDWQRRAGYLALCRENAIQRQRFQECPLEVQTAVFYDLLVNLLTGQADRQTAVTQWPQFLALPVAEQSRLYRLMAGKALLAGESGISVESWLQQARQLNPADKRNQLLAMLYRLHPALCRAFLRSRTQGQSGRRKPSPFANLNR